VILITIMRNDTEILKCPTLHGQLIEKTKTFKIHYNPNGTGGALNFKISEKHQICRI